MDIMQDEVCLYGVPWELSMLGYPQFGTNGTDRAGTTASG